MTPQSFWEFFRTLETKDWITIGVSSAALLVSALGYIQKSVEGKLALRKQLTELLEKLADLNTEIAKFKALDSKGKADEYPPNYIGLQGDQRRFLVRQAEFVSRRIKKLVSPYEYLLIAAAFDGVDDIYQAEYFYKRAIDTATPPLDKGIAIRSYARFLLGRARLEEGRKEYSLALDTLKGGSDHLRQTRGDTYERWADQEREWGNMEESSRLLREALREADTIDHPGRKIFQTTRLNERLRLLAE